MKYTSIPSTLAYRKQSLLSDYLCKMLYTFPTSLCTQYVSYVASNLIWYSQCYSVNGAHYEVWHTTQYWIEPVVAGVEIFFIVVVANNAQAQGVNVAGYVCVCVCVCVCLFEGVVGWVEGTSPPITKASHVLAVCTLIILQASQSPTSKVYSCI